MNGAADEAPAGNGNGDAKPRRGTVVNHASTNELVFKNLSFKVKLKGEELQILKGVSGSLTSGRLLAVMGPSGAGKTTLLDLITLETKGGQASGLVTLNATRLTNAILQKHCACVTQQDHHWAFLTCEETVAYAAQFYLPDAAPQRAHVVQRMLSRMGLTDCADTKVGNVFLRGLSGGQKRRLSLAVALIKGPLAVFMDEPTSGLDAAAASSIMTFVKELVISTNLIALATIHQPSANVFAGFDQTMVLTKGQMAYCGPATDMVAYFESKGYNLPPLSNPAEFVLDLVNAEFTAPAQVDNIIAEWRGSAEASAMEAASNIVQTTEELEAHPGKGLASQLWTNLLRQVTLLSRDPTIYIARMFMYCFACSFFAIIYINCRDRTQEQIQNRFFLIMWFIGVPSSLCAIGVLAFNGEFFSIRKEIRNGMYNPTAYLLANMLVQLPAVFLLAASAITVAGYGIAAFDWAQYPQFLTCYAITLFFWESLAQMLSVAFANPLIGLLMFLNGWFTAFLFAGAFIPVDDVIWPFRVFCYVSPLKHMLGALVYTEFHESTFSKAFPDEASSKGFSCEDSVDNLQCYGRTGPQVLKSLNNFFEVVPFEDETAQAIGISLAIAGFVKIQYLIIFFLKTRGSPSLKECS